MSAPSRERLSPVDTAWLRMDRPGNLMMICGVLVLSGRVSIARLRRVITERFLTFSRFACMPHEAAGAAYWVRDEDFRIAAHVVAARLPAPGGEAELQAFVSTLMSEPLPAAGARWQFHLIDGYRDGSAIVVRIHHSYADGIALVRVMLSMTDAGPDGPPAMPFAPRARRSATRANDEYSGWLAPVDDALGLARRLAGAVVSKGVAVWSDPAKAVELAGKGTALTAELARLALMRQDSPTRFKGTVAPHKRVAWGEPLVLDEVKAVARALGASVNDVLLAGVAGALRDYLLERGDAVEGVFVRALVPVNLRPLEEAWRLGNRFGLVFLDLPLDLANPVERLYAVRANMRALRDSYEPVVALALLAAMGAGPRALQEALLVTLARNATAVMTNVPGPQQPLYLAGRRIDNMMFWVPQSGDIGMGVSILSYGGKVQFGIVTDAGLCPDPERIVVRFPEEFEKLLLTTLMVPWPAAGEDLDPAVAEAAVAQ